MSETDSRAEVDTIATTIERIVKSDAIAQDDKERALATMAESMTRLISAAQLAMASLRATHNARVSGAARLSPEAVSIIILFLNKLDDRLVASQICRLWRSEALSMSNPWPKVCFHSLGSVDMGNTKHLEVEHYHCYYNISDDIFLKTNSNLHLLSRLLDFPWKARVVIDFRLTSHCDTPDADSVRQRINKIFKSEQPITRTQLAAALGNDVSSDFINILHPLSAAAHRIASLMLTVLCSDWLDLFAFLPPMTALRTLVITAHDDWELGADEPLALPDTLHSIMGETSPVPPQFQLRVAFPVLERLEVDGISCTDSSYPPLKLHLSARRVASFLSSMPLLRSLDLRLEVWPTIILDDGGDAAETNAAPKDTDKSSQLQGRESTPVKVDMKNLNKIVLCSAGGDETANVLSISRLMSLIQVHRGCRIAVNADEAASADTDSDGSASADSP